MTKFSTLILAALVAGTLNVHAVDSAAAAGDLAEISMMSVLSKAALSEASLTGDVDAIAEAGKRSDAVDAALAQAQDAYAAMERALENNDEDAAASAVDELKSSLSKAVDALSGVIPDEIMQAVQQMRNNRRNSGARGRQGGPVNVYNVPWNSKRMRDFYQNHFSNCWESGIHPHDRETTPE